MSTNELNDKELIAIGNYLTKSVDMLNEMKDDRLALHSLSTLVALMSESYANAFNRPKKDIVRGIFGQVKEIIKNKNEVTKKIN